MPDFAQRVVFSLWVANTEFYDKLTENAGHEDCVYIS